MNARTIDLDLPAPPNAHYGLEEPGALHLAWPGPPPHRTRCGRLFYGGQAHWLGRLPATPPEALCPSCRKSWQRAAPASPAL